MRIIEYFDVNDFYNEHKQTLLENEAINQFIIYNVFNCLKQRRSDTMFFGAVVNDMDVVLLFSIFASSSIDICMVNKNQLIQAVDELVEYLINKDIKINEIRGNNEVCVNFIERFKKHTDCPFVKIIGMDIMEIRQIYDIKQADGVQRLALPDEVQLVTDWMIESQLEALSIEMDYEEVSKQAAKYIDDNRVYFFENDDKVVSMVIKERELVKGVALTFVFTPEEYRGEGYAAANVYYLSKALLDEGYEFCTLLVDKKNPLSVRTYEKIGYVILEECYEYKIFPAED